MASKKDLDSILDDALDDFEDANRAKEVIDTSGDKDLQQIMSQISKEGEEKANNELINQFQQLMSDVGDPNNSDHLEKTFKAMSGNLEGMENLTSMMDMLKDNHPTPSSQDPMMAGQNQVESEGGLNGERVKNQTLKMMGNAGRDMEGMDSNTVEEAGEELMTEMIGEFEKLGQKEDYGNVVDGIMRQLLSKEIMFEPMKQVVEEYPRWLARKKDALSIEEYQRYGQQYQYFQRILAVYETEPDNFSRLMELMFDVQQYGQPPAEIIKDLAPGLEFDSNGMPVMPNMGANMFPSSDGPGGIPTIPGMSSGMPPIPGQNEQCVVS